MDHLLGLYLLLLQQLDSCFGDDDDCCRLFRQIIDAVDGSKEVQSL
jgi:hypothetical protein